MNLVTTLSDRIGVLEADLLKTKKTYSSAYTKLILTVKARVLDNDLGNARDTLGLFCQMMKSDSNEVIKIKEGSEKASDMKIDLKSNMTWGTKGSNCRDEEIARLWVIVEERKRAMEELDYKED
ncbi:hypothetical protein Tco_0323464 [Tanacetum coccineum]